MVIGPLPGLFFGRALVIFLCFLSIERCVVSSFGVVFRIRGRSEHHNAMRDHLAEVRTRRHRKLFYVRDGAAFERAPQSLKAKIPWHPT